MKDTKIAVLVTVDDDIANDYISTCVQQVRCEGHEDDEHDQDDFEILKALWRGVIMMTEQMSNKDSANCTKWAIARLKDIEKECSKYSAKNDIEISFVQSNIEGEIVNIIQKSRDIYQGVIINAAGYTHTSDSINDALAILKIPAIELHITNIY